VQDVFLDALLFPFEIVFRFYFAKMFDAAPGDRFGAAEVLFDVFDLEFARPSFRVVLRLGEQNFETLLFRRDPLRGLRGRLKGFFELLVLRLVEPMA